MDVAQNKVYASLVSLRGNPYFNDVMSFVEVEREKVKEQMTACGADRFLKLQGEAAAYERLLKMVREAPDVVQRINTKG